MDELPLLDRKWNYRWLLLLIAVMMAGFYAWAALSSIEQHVRGNGRIVPAGQAKIVQNLEGGIVDEIAVHEGQTIEKNVVLMQISNQRAKSDLEEQKIILAGKQVRMARLHAEQEGKDIFDYPDEGNAALKKLADSEAEIFDSRKQSLHEKISILNEQINQKQLKLQDLDAQLGNTQAERKVAQEQLGINERLMKSGAVSQSRYLDSKGRVTSFDTRIEQIRNAVPITKAEIEEIKRKIDGEKKDFQSEVADEINKTELDMRQLRERMRAQFDQVERTAIVSPVRGIVNKVHITTSGGVVQPGEPLVEIIPLDEDLIVEAKVPAKDRGRIWVGLPVMVKVTAYDFALYGGVSGTLTEISADSFTNERGDVFYRARISLKDKTLGDKPLYPGMIVNADIISGETSILHALLKPFWRIRETALREG